MPHGSRRKDSGVRVYQDRVTPACQPPVQVADFLTFKTATITCSSWHSLEGQKGKRVGRSQCQARARHSANGGDEGAPERARPGVSGALAVCTGILSSPARVLTSRDRVPRKLEWTWQRPLGGFVLGRGAGKTLPDRQMHTDCVTSWQSAALTASSLGVPAPRPAQPRDG